MTAGERRVARLLARLPAPEGGGEDGCLPEDMGDFLLAAWRARAVELGRPPPDDLSGACKFVSLFVASLTGGGLRGNALHQHAVTPDGAILDPCGVTADVRRMRDAGHQPHRHDPAFWGSPDHAASLESALPRVAAWRAAWRERASRPGVTGTGEAAMPSRTVP